jgi:5-methylcytosine-specific restriction endonuclease McrA
MKSKKYRNELLQAVENKSTREAEKALLQTAQKYEPTFLPSPKESIRYFDGQNSTLKITISHELEQKLNHLRQILSHKKPNMSYAELLEILADRALDKLEPKAKEQKSTPAPEVKSNKSRYIPTKVKRYIWQKYGRRCSYTDPKTGRRCQSRHLLQIDHKLPLALGGTSATANLRLLCRAHNLYSAEWMGLAVEPPSVTKKDNGARSSG